jgi:hypothetical protein
MAGVGRRSTPAEVTRQQQLQRTIGNQAMLRLLAQPTRATRNEPAAHEKADNATGMIHRETAAPPRSPGPIQEKLKIGAMKDPLEQEADSIADKMTPSPAPQVFPTRAEAPQVSRKYGEREKEVRLKKSGGPQVAAGEAPAIVHEVLDSPGRPLDDATRAYFEPRFRHDFSRVRVHTGTSAQQSARDVNAHAYTVGHHMAFDAGRFAPETHDGQRLLAHELTHVVQQAGVGPSLQREPRGPEPDVRPESKPKDSNPAVTPFVSSDLVKEIKRDNETWMLTIDGYTSEESVKRLIWPYFVPPGITISPRRRLRVSAGA